MILHSSKDYSKSYTQDAISRHLSNECVTKNITTVFVNRIKLHRNTSIAQALSNKEYLPIFGSGFLTVAERFFPVLPQ